MSLAAQAFTAICALGFGTWRERAGAGILLAMMAFNFGLHMLTHSDGVWRHFIIDGPVLMGFIALVWKSPHPWPMWAAGCQLFAVGLEINTLLNPNILKYGFYLLLYIIAYGVSLSLLAGAWAALKMRKKLG